MFFVSIALFFYCHNVLHTYTLFRHFQFFLLNLYNYSRFCQSVLLQLCSVTLCNLRNLSFDICMYINYSKEAVKENHKTFSKNACLTFNMRTKVLFPLYTIICYICLYKPKTLKVTVATFTVLDFYIKIYQINTQLED